PSAVVPAVASPAAWLLPLPPHPASSAAMDAVAIAPASKRFFMVFLLVLGAGPAVLWPPGASPNGFEGTGFVYSLSDCDFIIGAGPAGDILAIHKKYQILDRILETLQNKVMILVFLHSDLILTRPRGRYNGKNKNRNPIERSGCVVSPAFFRGKRCLRRRPAGNHQLPVLPTCVGHRHEERRDPHLWR